MLWLGSLHAININGKIFTLELENNISNEPKNKKFQSQYYESGIRVSEVSKQLPL